MTNLTQANFISLNPTTLAPINPAPGALLTTQPAGPFIRVFLKPLVTWPGLISDLLTTTGAEVTTPMQSGIPIK
jgi:hypothetical protein